MRLDVDACGRVDSLDGKHTARSGFSRGTTRGLGTIRSVDERTTTAIRGRSGEMITMRRFGVRVIAYIDRTAVDSYSTIGPATQ